MNSRTRRFLQSIRKEIPEAVEVQDHDDAEVAAMLRELGIALIECEQPAQLVRARLLAIAKQYTHETVRVVVLPTALVVQVGNIAYEVETDRAVHLSVSAQGVAAVADARCRRGAGRAEGRWPVPVADTLRRRRRFPGGAVRDAGRADQDVTAGDRDDACGVLGAGPGALSFQELGQAVAGSGNDVATLGVTVAAIFSIALGTLVGWSVLETIRTRLGR